MDLAMVFLVLGLMFPVYMRIVIEDPNARIDEVDTYNLLERSGYRPTIISPPTQHGVRLRTCVARTRTFTHVP